VWDLCLVEKHARNIPYVVPIKSCPRDALKLFYKLLRRYRSVTKVGFGLKINDLPNHYAHKARVKRWEKQFWDHEISPGVFRAPIDTTFALYRAGTEFGFAALRTGAPYVARHLPWYMDSMRPSREEKFYRAHLRRDFSNWNQVTLPSWLVALIDKQ